MIPGISIPGIFVSDEPANDVTGTVSEFAVRTPASSIPESARAVMRLSLVDWAAVAWAGGAEPAGRMVRDMVVAEGGTAEATVVGYDRKLPARAAALANATIGHALDYDDTHFIHIGHTSTVVVPAALAVAQKTQSGPAEFLDACLIGVETACRVGAWLGRTHYLEGFHPTATSGSFGAAMAAARLFGLDPDQARHAIGLTATRASGLKCQFGTMGKPYNAGMAASNGVETATLAASGFVSCTRGLEMDQGFAATHHGEGHSDALADIGNAFVFEDVKHKYHACCHGTHAALEALIEVRDEKGIKAEEITAIRLHVNPCWRRVCNIPEPATGLEAKFSYRLTAALVMLGHDTAALETFNEEVCGDPAVIELRDKVDVEFDDAVPDTAARIQIEMGDGAPVEAAHDLMEPVPLSERQSRIRSKAESLLGASRAATLWSFVHDEDRLLSGWISDNQP